MNPIASAEKSPPDVEAGVPKAVGAAPVAEWPIPSPSTAAVPGGQAAAYASAPTADASSASASSSVGADARPWLFHAIMALGGVYLAMVTTNWSTPSATSAGGNPEMSVVRYRMSAICCG